MSRCSPAVIGFGGRAINLSEFYNRERVESLRSAMKSSPVDGAWILRPENRRYLSGFKAEDSQLDESSGSLLISVDHQILLVDSRYREQASMEAPDFRVEQIKGDFSDFFSETAHRAGVRKIGFEKNYVTYGMHGRVSSSLGLLEPPGELIPLDNEVERLRSVKSPGELEALAVSARAVSEILDLLIDWIEPGVSERMVARHLVELAGDAGADGLSFPPIIASGPNSSHPHAVPTGRRLGKGEPVVIDVGVRVGGYCSDITRTIFMGNPGDDFKNVYTVVRRAQLAALELIRAGAVTCDVDRAARELIEEAGFGEYFGHGLGHGVGLAVHEAPRLSPRDSTVLKEGMVVTVEPGVYLPGRGGVRLEETVVVESQGPRILTCCDRFYDW